MDRKHFRDSEALAFLVLNIAETAASFSADRGTSRFSINGLLVLIDPGQALWSQLHD